LRAKFPLNDSKRRIKRKRKKKGFDVIRPGWDSFFDSKSHPGLRTLKRNRSRKVFYRIGYLSRRVTTLFLF
jgi:hypothetical protein